MEDRRQIDLASEVVANELNLNWRSYSSCGGPSLLIKSDLQRIWKIFQQN